MQFIGFGKVLKTLCSCKCLSPPPYLKFTLSPMYKNKTQRKREKETHNFNLELFCYVLSGRYGPYRVDTGLLNTHRFSASYYRARIEPISHYRSLLQLFPSHNQLWCLLSSSYRADTNTIEHHSATCIPPIPSLLGPSGRDMSKQTTPILVVCNELHRLLLKN